MSIQFGLSPSGGGKLSPNLPGRLFVLVSLFFFVFPVYWCVVTSLKTGTAAFQVPPQWLFTPTFENFTAVVKDPSWAKAYGNSLVIAVGSVCLSLVCGTLAAYGLARMGCRGRGLLLLVVIWTRMIPPVALVVPLYSILRDCGLLDRHASMVLLYASIDLPYAIWMMWGFISEIPVELEEAAMVDGATRLGVLTRVVLPLVAPGMVATALFCLIVSWNEFFYALVLTRYEAKTVPVVIGGYLRIYTIQWGEMSAAALLAVVPAIVFSVLIQKHLVRGFSGGLLK